MQILYSYLRYTGKLLSLFLFLTAVILLELYEKPRRKDRVTKKVYRRICVRDITFFLLQKPPPYVTFCRFFRLLSPPSQVTYLLNGPYKDI